MSTASNSIHTLLNPGDLFIIQQRQSELLDMLRREGFFSLSDKRILELGCGAGGVLREFLSFGATPGLLHGIELLPQRLAVARSAAPHLPLVNGDGRHLPFPDRSFDLVMQFTVFSSILDNDVRCAIAGEMRRVLKPDGVILWYDFWINPVNPQTRGVNPSEIRGLFPGCRYSLRRITLAPPITRRLAPYSWMGCYVLEKLRIFNTHYLGCIRP